MHRATNRKPRSHNPQGASGAFAISAAAPCGAEPPQINRHGSVDFDARGLDRFEARAYYIGVGSAERPAEKGEETVSKSVKSVILVNSTPERRAEWAAMLNAVGIAAEVVGMTVEVEPEIARRWLIATDRIVEAGLGKGGPAADKLRLETLIHGYTQSRSEDSRSAARATARFLRAERENR